MFGDSLDWRNIHCQFKLITWQKSKYVIDITWAFSNICSKKIPCFVQDHGICQIKFSFIRLRVIDWKQGGGMVKRGFGTIHSSVALHWYIGNVEKEGGLV